tara:strand:- start:1076 stop:1282 length:207 start_codon:yes stop_codon:yes gene_type:complete
MQIGDLVKVYTGVGANSRALAVITEIEPIETYDGATIYWVTFVKENPYGTAVNRFKFSSHYIETLEGS